MADKGEFGIRIGSTCYDVRFAWTGDITKGEFAVRGDVKRSNGKSGGGLWPGLDVYDSDSYIITGIPKSLKFPLDNSC